MEGTRFIVSPPVGFEPSLLDARFLFPGDNILAVLRHLVMSSKLADSSEYRHGNMVFFDLLGVVVVAYPARVGTILNYMVAAASFLYLAKKASQPGNGGKSPYRLRRVASCGFCHRRVLVLCVCCFRGFVQTFPLQTVK